MTISRNIYQQTYPILKNHAFLLFHFVFATTYQVNLIRRHNQNIAAKAFQSEIDLWVCERLIVLKFKNEQNVIDYNSNTDKVASRRTVLFTTDSYSSEQTWNIIFKCHVCTHHQNIYFSLLVNVHHLISALHILLQQDRDVLNAFHGYVRTYWLLHRDGFLSDVDDDSSRSTSPEVTMQSTEKSGGEAIYGFKMHQKYIS